MRNVLMLLVRSCNGVVRRLLLIVKPYSATEMFVTHNIPSFLRKCVYSFRERIAHSANKKNKALFISHRIYPLSNPTMLEISIVFILTFFSLVLLL